MTARRYVVQLKAAKRTFIRPFLSDGWRGVGQLRAANSLREKSNTITIVIAETGKQSRIFVPEGMAEIVRQLYEEIVEVTYESREKNQRWLLDAKPVTEN